MSNIEKRELTLTYNSGNIELLDDSNKKFKIKNNEKFPRNLTIISGMMMGYEYEKSFVLSFDYYYILFDTDSRFRFNIFIEFNNETYIFNKCKIYSDDPIYLSYYSRMYFYLENSDFTKNKKEIKRLLKDLYEFYNSHDNGEFNIPISMTIVEDDRNLELKLEKEQDQLDRIKLKQEKIDKLNDTRLYHIPLSSSNIEIEKFNYSDPKSIIVKNDTFYIKFRFCNIDNDPKKEVLFIADITGLELEKNKKYIIAIKYCNKKCKENYIIASESFILSDSKDQNKVLYVEYKKNKKQKKAIQRFLKIFNKFKTLFNDGSKYAESFELTIHKN